MQLMDLIGKVKGIENGLRDRWEGCGTCRGAGYAWKLHSRYYVLRQFDCSFALALLLVSLTRSRDLGWRRRGIWNGYIQSRRMYTYIYCISRRCSYGYK